MALFRLATAEACHINFINLQTSQAKWWYWNAKPESWSRDTWASKRQRFVFHARVKKLEVTESGYEVWLNATDEAILELRAALPFGYHVEDDGRLHREDLKGFGGVDGEIILDLAQDAGAVLCPVNLEDHTSAWFNAWVGIGTKKLRTVYGMMADIIEPLTLNARASQLIYGNQSGGYLNKKESRLLLRTEKHFIDALEPIKGYVRDRLVPAAESSKAGRKVVLLSEDDEHERLDEEDFLATRCTKGAGASFVRFGLRWNRTEKTLKLANFETKIKEGYSDWNRHEPMLLIHKAHDAWRTVALLPMFYYGERLQEKNLYLLPVYYMIPVTVSKNEVTFAHMTFRGVKLTTQQRIWDVDGMSMAISHALMPLTNQLKKMPSPYFIDGHKTEVPKNHRVAMLGRGKAASQFAGHTPVKDLLNGAGYFNDGPYCKSIYNGSYPIQVTRAADILDDIFSDLPRNRIEPGPKKKVYNDTLTSQRRVLL